MTEGGQRSFTKFPLQSGTGSRELGNWSLSPYNPDPRGWHLRDMETCYNHSMQSIHDRGTGTPSPLKLALDPKPWSIPTSSLWT